MAALSDERFAVAGPSVMKLRHLQQIIHLETVCIDDAIRKDLLSDNWNQRRRLHVRAFGIMAVLTLPPRFKSWKRSIMSMT